MGLSRENGTGGHRNCSPDASCLDSFLIFFEGSVLIPPV